MVTTSFEQKGPLISYSFVVFQGLAAHFKCPLVVISPIGNSHIVSSLVGNPESVAATPNVFLNYKTPMTFLQRVKNFAMYFFESAIKQYLIYKSEKFYK
jgi:hypothetical protein